GALGANAATEGSFYATSANTAALAAQVAAYSFSAGYAGDSNYNAISSGTHNHDTFFVNKRTLTLTTTVHDASHATVANGAHVPLGSVMHDNAALSGATTGVPPTFPTRRSSDLGALGANAATEGSFYATSANTAALAAQVAAYSFSAGYAGDSNYNAIS